MLSAGLCLEVQLFRTLDAECKSVWKYTMSGYKRACHSAGAHHHRNHMYICD